MPRENPGYAYVSCPYYLRISSGTGRVENVERIIRLDWDTVSELGS